MGIDLNGKRIFFSCCLALGDVVTCTPALRLMKKKYPSCVLTVMTKTPYTPLIDGLPYIDEVVGFRRHEFLGRAKLFQKLLRQDMIALLDWNPHVVTMAYLMRVPIRNGVVSGGGGHFAKRWLTKIVERTNWERGTYAGVQRGKTISELFFLPLMPDELMHCDVAEPEEATCNEVGDMLKAIGIKEDEPYILLSPFSAYKNRCWPTANAKKFVALMEKKYSLPVIVTGMESQRSMAEGISKYNIIGKTGLGHLIALIKRSYLVVTPDSGPMHIAGALKKNMVLLFTTGAPEIWTPQNDNCTPLALDYPCMPCRPWGGAADCADMKCLDIPAEMVAYACEKYIK